MEFLHINRPTPVLNTSNFCLAFGGRNGSELPRNDSGHPIHNEFVALPGMSFPIVTHCSDTIVQISWPLYGSLPLYVDRRFGTIINDPPMQKPLAKLDLSLLSKMEEWIGTPYVWGGNWKNGIAELLELYPPKTPLDDETKTLWTFQGLDCSGLLFQASGGITPRNTSHLMHFGNPLVLSPWTIQQIILLVEPLDMILHPGHVLFVRDKETIIESKSPFGVRLYPIEKRLEELFSEKRSITIRRFVS